MTNKTKKDLYETLDMIETNGGIWDSLEDINQEVKENHKDSNFDIFLVIDYVLGESSKIFDVVNLDITQKRKKTIDDFF
jgi:hypothetical protein